MLWALVPEDVVRRRKNEIYEVMGELAGIVGEEDGSSWPHSRKKCLEYAYGFTLADSNLEPKLRNLVHTLGL